MPGYIHADVPHEKTVAGPDFRYGCHSQVTGNAPRGRTTHHEFPAQVVDYDEKDVPEGFVRLQIAAHTTTEWLPMRCGHSTRAADRACEGCSNRGSEAKSPEVPSLVDDSFADKALAAIDLSLCMLPSGEVSNRAELLVRPTDIRTDEAGRHPGERFVLVTITREEVRELLEMMDRDVAEVRAACATSSTAADTE